MALLAEIDVGYVERFGNSVRVSGIPHRLMARAADTFMDVLARHRPSQDDAFDIPTALARGSARCVCAEGMEEVLTESEIYVIREIPNALGHVVVFRPAKSPLVGIHLERFELLP
jgi:hypothetical protein